MITSALIPTDEEFTAIRDQLLAQIDEHESRPSIPHLVEPKPRRTWAARRRVLVGAAAAIAAGALVATGGFGIAGEIASAQAATVLHEASTSAFATSDPALKPGQYIKFETHELAVGVLAGSGGEAGHYTSSQTWTIYQPATSTDPWVLVRAEQAPKDPVGAAAVRAVKDWKPDPSLNAVRVGYNGTIPDWTSYQSVVDTLPRNVAAVHDYLYAEPVSPDSSWNADQQAWQRALDLLAFEYVPADLRGDLFQAMAEIPGVEVSDKQATIDGHTGVGIALASAHGSGQEIIIDPKTGQYLGFKQDGDVRAVTVAVVDSAPSR